MGESVQVAPQRSTPRERPLSSRLPHWQAVALLLLIAWLYASTLARLFLQWVGPHKDANFEHGIFVPLFALFVLWQDRKKLQNIPASPSWAGLPLVIISLLMLVIGDLGAESFSSCVSLLILLAGLILLFEGWPLFRAVLFPWAFLILMIPIPNLLLQQVTFPLQMLAAALSTDLLQLVNVPVLREGNIITLASMPLNVAEACSGIRSLLSLITLSIIYGYLLETRMWARVALVCSAVPIAVAANSFRIFGTGLLVQYWDPEKAEGFYHALGGWLIFVVALLMLFAVHRLISLIGKSGPASRDLSIDDLGLRDSAPSQRAPANNLGLSFNSLRFGIVAVPMLATAIGLQRYKRNEYFPPRAPLSSLPSQIGGWTGKDDPLDQATLDILGPGEFLLRDYERTGSSPSPQSQSPQSETQSVPWINLYIAYFPTQKAGDTIHSPQHCLPGAGWVPTLREVVQITGPDGSSFPANRYVVSSVEEKRLVLYWFQAHGREVASEYWAKYYLVSDSVRMNRSDGALVRLMTPMLDNESPDAAEARLMKLGSQFLPLLDNYIPR